MKIKSTKSFRQWIFEQEEARRVAREYYDPDFLGSKNADGKTGFFSIFHGIKNDLKGFLRKEVEMAEDGQAIYEFMQNAADCGSTNFYLFYDERNFLVINNGAPFSKEGVQSILNVGQSHGKEDCGKIGRFGIGFKLVHRLVGESSGLKELMEDYAGPILFSWSNRTQFHSFLDGNIESFEDSGNLDDPDSAWLLKILLTNFPAAPRERLKTLKEKEEEDRDLFSEADLLNFYSYLSRCRNYFETSTLDQGTAFYLRLGKGKYEKLAKDHNELKKGVECSLHFLNSLNQVTIGRVDENGEEIIDKIDILVELFGHEPFEIGIGSPDFNEIPLQEDRDRKCGIQLDFRYVDYRQAEKVLKRSPNFFKYFPMGDEINGYCFILHSTVFDIKSDRRRLHDSPINRGILKVLVKLTLGRLLSFQETGLDKFEQIYANLLLSDEPETESNRWQNEYLYEPLLNFLKNQIPTCHFKDLDKPKSQRFKGSSDQVRIKHFTLPVNPSDFGLEDIEWFFWEENSTNNFLTQHANKKLGIERWRFSKLLAHGLEENINIYIRGLNIEQYDNLVEELGRIKQEDWDRDDNALFNKFLQLEYLEFEGEDVEQTEFCSIDVIRENEDYLILDGDWVDNNNFDQLFMILKKIGFKVSKRVITRSTVLGRMIHENVSYLKSRSGLIKKLNSKLCQNKLQSGEKHFLFQSLKKLDNLGPALLKKMELFSDNQGVVQPLEVLLPSNVNSPTWLDPFKIATAEHQCFFNNGTDELSALFLKVSDVYQQIIKTDWENIIEALPASFDVGAFYQEVTGYYDISANDKSDIPSDKVIYTPEGFKKAEEVFFSSILAEVNNHNLTASVIEVLTGFPVPHKDAVTYLSEAPFHVQSENIAEDFNIREDVPIDDVDTKAFIEFLQLNRQNFFRYYYLLEKEGQFLVKNRQESTLVFYTDRESLEAFITTHADDFEKEFYPLPAPFFEFSNKNPLVLRGEALELELIDSIDVEEHQEEIVSILEYNRTKKAFLRKLGEIQVFPDTDYQQDDFLVEILRLVKDFQDEDSVIQDFRDNLRIQTENESFSIHDIPSPSTTIRFSFQEQEKPFELDLLRILPKSYERTIVVRKIVNQLEKHALGKKFLQMLFQLNKDSDADDKAIICRDLPDELDDQVLEKAQQLAFVLLYAKETEDERMLSRFKVQTLDGEYTLEYPYYLDDFPFVKNNATLSQQYQGIKELLRLSYRNPVFTFGNSSILLEPYFEESAFHIPESTFEDASSKVAFLDFLFVKWSKSKSIKREIQNINWGRNGDFDLSRCLGFNPKLSVFCEEQMILEEETLQDWVVDWVKFDEMKLEFLSDLGVHTGNGIVFRLRRYFIDSEVELTPDDIKQSFRSDDEEDNSLLVNTLKIWESQSLRIVEEEKLLIIKEVYDLLPAEDYVDQVPMLYLADVQGDAFIFTIKENDEDAFMLDDEAIHLLEEKHIPIQQLFQLCSSENRELLPIRIYPDRWREELVANKIELSEPVIDFEELFATSEEWADQRYLQWKVALNEKYTIRLYNGAIPASIYLADIEEPLSIVKVGDVILNEDDGTIYFNRESSTESRILLQKLFREESISAEDYLAFVEGHFIPTDEEQPTPTPDDYDGNEYMPPGEGISADDQMAYSEEAKRIVKARLIDQGFDVSGWKDYHSHVTGVRNPEGELMNIIVKSAKGGKIFISPTNWVELAEPNAMLLVVNHYNDVSNVTFEDLMSGSRIFHVQFSTRSLSGNEIAALGRAFQYVSDIRFIIDSPNFSHADYFDTFGLNETQEGEVHAMDDDVFNDN